MKYTKEQVLRIVDSCFHMYSSSYRTDAKDSAIEIMKGMDKQNVANGDNTTHEKCTLPVVSQQRELLRAYHTYLLTHTDKEECNHTIEEFLIARNSG